MRVVTSVLNRPIPMATTIQRLLVIGGEPSVWDKLQPLLADDRGVGEIRRIHQYPSSEELARVVYLFPPDVIFLGLESAPAAAIVMADIDVQAPSTPVVGFNRLDDTRAVTEWMRAGIREIVKPPFTREQIQEVIPRMAALAARRNPHKVHKHLCAFLPSRAGSGTSTLACHLARTLATEHRGQVLLADFDLISSSLRYFLNLNAGATIRDVAETIDCMDSRQWQECVVRMDRLDVLNAGQFNPRRPLRTETVARLLSYAATHYNVMFADLSGNMETYSLEVLRSSGAIFVVTQPDALSLGAARDKADFLDSLGLKSRAGLLVRQPPNATLPPSAQLERYCGLPVSGVFDYTGCRAQHLEEDLPEKPLPSGLRKQLALMAKAVAQTAASPVLRLPIQPAGFAANWF